MTAEQFLRRHKGISHRMLVRLKRLPNGICCNGRQIRTIDMVQFGDEIVLTDCEVPSALAPSAAAVPVLGETDSYIVYNKPAGMPVHPSQGHHGDTLGNVFAAQFPQLPFRPVYRPGQRHQRHLSGCQVCLRRGTATGQHPKDLSGTGLRGTFHRRHGRCSHWQSRRFRAVPVCPSGGQARSAHYTPLRSDGTYTLLSLWLETGRTHQIRVHMAYLGYPLAGDRLYGTSSEQFPHHMLHCDSLEFPDPETGECRQFSAACPWNSCV